MFKTSTRKTKYGYKGYLHCCSDSGEKLWTETLGAIRTTREDAMEDAEFLKKDRLGTFKGEAP